MTEKPTYEELDQEVQSLKKTVREKDYIEDIYHSIGQSVLLLDQDQNILSVNRITEKITGLSANELKGKKCYQVFHGPEITSPPESCPFQKLLTTENVEVEEIEVETLERIFLISCTPIFDNNSKLKRVIHIATDITENKRAVEKLKYSEEQYRALVNNIQAAVVTHGADTSVIGCNPKAHELLGLKQNQMIGRMASDPKWNFLNSNGNKMPLEQYPVNQVLATQQKVRNQTIGIFRPDKDDFVWVLVSADPVFDVKGKIQQIIVTFMDITEHKKMEQSLQESEEKYRTLAEECPISIMTFNQKGIVTFVNKWHLKTFAKLKHGPEFFIGKKITELPGLVSAKVIPDIEKVLQGESVVLEGVHFPEFTGGHSGYQSIKAVPTYKKKRSCGWYSDQRRCEQT